MTKQELIEMVASATQMTQPQVRAVVEASITAIKENVADGDTLYIRGFGTLRPAIRKAKLARNIGKGTSMVVPAHYVPAFKPCREFKAMMKGCAD